MTTQGSRLKKIRKILDLSQGEFGNKIGLTRGAIAAVEADSNNFSQEILCKLIQEFNINLNYLLVGKGQPFNMLESDEIRNEIINNIENILLKYEIKKIN